MLALTAEQRLEAYEFLLKWLAEHPDRPWLCHGMEDWLWDMWSNWGSKPIEMLDELREVRTTPKDAVHGWWGLGERGILERRIVLLKSIKQVKLLIEAKDILG